MDHRYGPGPFDRVLLDRLDHHGPCRIFDGLLL
jgi:hypothetical protein